MKSTLVVAAGIYCLVFALFHMTFWRLFRWKADLQRVTPVNRGIMQVLNLRLTYVFLMIGGLLLLFQSSIHSTAMGQFVLWAMCVFWVMRAIEQILFFGIRSAPSAVLFLIFLAGGVLFAAPMIV